MPFKIKPTQETPIQYKQCTKNGLCIEMDKIRVEYKAHLDALIVTLIWLYLGKKLNLRF